MRSFRNSKAETEHQKLLHIGAYFWVIFEFFLVTLENGRVTNNNYIHMIIFFILQITSTNEYYKQKTLKTSLTYGL